jgi:hypothetical protein
MVLGSIGMPNCTIVTKRDKHDKENKNHRFHLSNHEESKSKNFHADGLRLFNSTDIWLNFTITVPDAWKTGPMPPPYVGQVTSLKAYMDGSLVGQNRELWVGPELRLDGSKSFAVKLDESTSGLHTLNVTVVSETYYTGPAVNGSHIPYYLDDGGTVYKYPAATSDIRYFTVEQSTQSIQDINIQPLAQSDSALPSWVIPLTVIGAIAIAAAAMLLMRKKTHV